MVSKKKTLVKKGKPKKTTKSGKKHSKTKIKSPAKKLNFDSKYSSLHLELSIVRHSLKKNDSLLSKNLAEKFKLENSLNLLLTKNFDAEKELLSAIKTNSAKKQAALRKQISSLSKINKVYKEKKARIDFAKKKQNALKKQLQLLEQKVGD